MITITYTRRIQQMNEHFIHYTLQKSTDNSTKKFVPQQIVLTYGRYFRVWQSTPL